MDALPFLVAEFPIPPLQLSQNGRFHWVLKAKATKAYRTASKVIFRGARVKSKIATRETASIVATFYWPDRRRRDRMNAMERLKPIWDGMQDALIVMDDSGLTFQPVQFKLDKKNPRVVVEVFDTQPTEARQ